MPCGFWLASKRFRQTSRPGQNWIKSFANITGIKKADAKESGFERVAAEAGVEAPAEEKAPRSSACSEPLSRAATSDRSRQSGRGQPHSKTWRNNVAPCHLERLGVTDALDIP